MSRKPLYKVGDTVSFNTKSRNGSSVTVTGEIHVVDESGTFFQTKEPSYDIYAPDVIGGGEVSALYKHIPESWVFPPKGE